MIVFGNELSPAQQRNWERESGLVVIDRQEVILDIFAERAHTKEAVLQGFRSSLLTGSMQCRVLKMRGHILVVSEADV